MWSVLGKTKKFIDRLDRAASSGSEEDHDDEAMVRKAKRSDDIGWMRIRKVESGMFISSNR